MATQTPAVDCSRIGSAVEAGRGLMRALFTWGAGRRRRQELLLALVDQLGRLAEEMHRANLIQFHQMITGQLDRAIDDPALAAVLSTLDDLSDGERRQMLFANREYATNVLAYRVGMYDWGELVGALRVLCRNGVFATYWRRTVEHRLSLPDDSLEGRIAKAVDAVLEELDEDPDEWWVVGLSEESSS
ncbi:DUF6082 family protein [Streptomyces canus]|uniref:DUF6082 family protein n=1 Tax=Streptomyces canus TaxID=58343 RepID=UPI00369DB6B4